MEKVFAQLDSTHQKLLQTIMPIDEDRFKRRPAPEQWSIAEIMHHLCLVEQRVIKGLEAELSEPPVRVRLLQRLMPVGLLVGSRVKRVKAPKTVEPHDPPSKEEVIANYENVRSRLKEFSAAHGHDRMKQLAMKHPFLGTFDGVTAIAFVGHHERRHFKQIKETIRKLGN
jgi:DinB superfamily